MTRLSTRTAVCAILLALASSAVSETDSGQARDIDALRLGEQMAGDRLTIDDLEGRVVLAYHWCVS